MRTAAGLGLVEAGQPVTTLDIDERLAHLPGFRVFNVYRPNWLGDSFGLILSAPPFFKVSLSQLFTAIRCLARNNFEQPLMVSYLKRREAAILGTFAKFGLAPSGYRPS